MLAIVVILAFVAPGVLGTVQELIKRAGVRVATGVGIVLLTLVYFSLFLPASLWLRLIRTDTLNRSFPGGRTSNWVDRIGYGTDKVLYTKPYSRPHSAERSGGSGK
jgi:multisubunit Na+/H+ antiporter MnhB subunit